MAIEWIASPFAVTGLLAVGMTACAALFVTLKREIAESEARHKEKVSGLQAAADEMRASIENLRRALEESEERSAAAARPLSGMNLSKRGQVLRMYRRGEKPEQIAAALSIPLNEVELLVKVHRTVIGQL